MSKKVLLFSRDPGGANVITPIVKPLTERGYEVVLFGKDVALSKYQAYGLSGANIMDFVRQIKALEIEAFLKEQNPDFIITGTSADDMTEKFIWKAAETIGIPSFAILDQWVNYGIRFSSYGVSELAQYKSDKTHPFIPTKILVMDEYAYNEAIKDGLEPSRILITGQPYFEQLLQYKKRSSVESIEALKNCLNITGNDYLITYASEPISKTYKEDDGSAHYWGYTEKTIFVEIIRALTSVVQDVNRRIVLVVKLHPKEDSDSYVTMINQLTLCDNIVDTAPYLKTDSVKRSKIDVVVEQGSDPWDLILASDLICGMSSMFLLEAVILDRPVMSVQIGLNKDNPFILDRRGILKSILDGEALQGGLKKIIIENKSLKHEFKVIDSPVNNVISHMESHLCQN